MAYRPPDCAICLEQLGRTGTISAAACGHVFHTDCIKTWVTQEKRCPTCRADAVPGDLLKLKLAGAESPTPFASLQWRCEDLRGALNALETGRVAAKKRADDAERDAAIKKAELTRIKKEIFQQDVLIARMEKENRARALALQREANAAAAGPAGAGATNGVRGSPGTGRSGRICGWVTRLVEFASPRSRASANNGSAPGTQ